MRQCRECLKQTEELFFLRRDWRARRWTPVRKWQEVGDGLCRDCVIAKAVKLNEKIDVESRKHRCSDCPYGAIPIVTMFRWYREQKSPHPCHMEPSNTCASAQSFWDEMEKMKGIICKT